MGRLKGSQLDKIRKQHGVDTIYSWSRISCFAERPWEYYIRYIQKIRVDTSNVYTHFGTIVHDLVQGVYEGHHTKEDLPEMYQKAVSDWGLNPEFEFPNENIERGYIDNLTYYFRDIQILEDYNVIIEKPIKITFDHNGKDVVFIGYIDGMYVDEHDNIVILDFKTSSKSGYSGAKLKENSKQLMLYAIGVHQATCYPFERIKPRFDMAKYLTVSYLQQNGKWSKATMQERAKLVSSQENRIRKLLIDNDVNFMEADEIIDRAKALNDMSELPDYVRERFEIKQAYIDVEVNDELVAEFKDWVIEQVEEAERRSQADDLEAEFPEPNLDISAGDSFFYFNLAPNLLKYHKTYQEQQQLKARIENELDISSLDSDDALDDLFTD